MEGAGFDDVRSKAELDTSYDSSQTLDTIQSSNSGANIGSIDVACVNEYLSADRFFMEKGDVYHSLFKYNKAVTLLINPENFEIIDANNAACDYYGWPLEVITHMKIHDLNILPPDKVLEEMQNAVAEKRNYFLFRHKLANGQIRDVEVYSSPVIVNSQQLLYSIVHDITERKKAEVELHKRNMQLRTAQKIGHIGSWELNLNSGMMDSSDEAKRIYGYDTDNEILPLKEVQSVVLPEYRPMMDEAIRELIEHFSPYDVQYRIARRNDGAIRDIHSVAEYDAEKNIVIGTIQDVTERKKTEDALLHAKMVAEAANKSKDEFLATMSHELRTPLTSVIGFSDVLLDRTFGDLDEKQARYVTHISDAGKHLLKLINDVLDISKVEAGKMELLVEEFSVPVAIDEVQVLLSPLAKKKHIKMEVDLVPEVNIINADRTKFKQILYNLGSNAIKFAPEGSSVDISGKLMGSVIVISVEDSGIGISEEDIDKLFHPFTQLNSYLTRDQKGTGLGLALVRKFVELHEGRVWVESRFGEGSKFCFSIPVRADPVKVC